MKVVQLTAAQQAEAATLNAAVKSAVLPLQSARKALQAFLITVVPTTPKNFQRLVLTDDGTAVIVQ